MNVAVERASRTYLHPRGCFWGVKAYLGSFLGLLLVLLYVPLLAQAGQFTANGPLYFHRASGAPVNEVVNFTLPYPLTSYTLIIYNGGIQDDEVTGEAVSSSTIILNGTTIADSSNFNQNIAQISVPVSITTGMENTLEVELQGKPGGLITVVLVGEDNDLPTITASVAPSPNGAGWNTGATQVVFACNDATSSIVSCTEPVSINLEGANQAVTGTATDLAGNNASVTQIINLDSTAPALSHQLTPVANGAGWHDQPVVIDFTCSDGLSGVDSCPASETVSSEGAGQSVATTAVDVAGNSTVADIELNIDLTPPSISATPSALPNGNGWYNAAVTLNYSCDDALSGVAACTGPQLVSISGAGQVITGTAVDNAGLSSAVNTTLNVDLEVPVLAFVSPVDGAVLSDAQPVLQLSVSDNLSLDEGSLDIAVNGTPNAASCAISGATATCTLAAGLATSYPTLGATVLDMAGNSAQVSIAVLVDSDGDGVHDDIDQCAATPVEEAADADGCGESQRDDDADGVSNGVDQCPLTPAGEAVDANGCSQSQLDADGDGVTNTSDLCPDTPPGEVVDETGCILNQDTDEDGVLNDIDQCPATVAGTPVAADGCDHTQRDSDGDGVADVDDAFPNDASETSDLDGDGIGDSIDPDRDGDGVANGEDVFPDDSSETADLDGDGIGDNADPDRDGDGVPDDQDAFPDDATRSTLPLITIDSPATLTTVGSTPVHITGTVEGNPVSLTVNGAPVTASGGTFQADVALEEGHNTIVARMADAEGIISTASISISLDLTPPYLTIESHADNQTVHTPTVTITGLVNDIVRGTIEADQAVVTVNGISATIANRSYMAENIPLAVGANTITVQGIDQVGNSSAYSITLNYEPLPGRRLEVISGQNQTATINTALPTPLKIKVLDDNNQPVVATNVVFRVIQGAGVLAAGTENEGQGYLATTDANGIATASFKVGLRAGVGNHKVRARVVGWEDEAVFYASATPTLGNKLSVNSGNNQRSGVHQHLAAPFIVAVTDAGANLIKNARVQFDVVAGGGSFQNGDQSYETLTDSDGRASALLTLGGVTGFDKQKVVARLLDVAPNSNGTTPVVTAGFTATGFIPGDPGNTKISGVVLDNQDIPLPGVTIRVDGTTRQAVTDTEGQFVIENAPVGPVHLIADGSTTTVAGEFPSLSYNIVTVSGVDNPLASPIYMVKLNMSTAKWAGAEDVEITLPDVPGFKLEIPAGSVTFPDGSKEGYVSVTAVNSGKVPMAPPNGMQPQLIVTIQPTGALFDPPAKIVLPNVDGHKPGAQVEMFSYDHDLEEFVTIGLGTVSNNGTVITTNPGVGVVKAGWFCGAQPTGSGGCGSNDCGSSGAAQCESDQNDGCPGEGEGAGNPINIINGNKFERETDYVGAGSFPLRLERLYNSQFGGWRHGYQYELSTLGMTDFMVEFYELPRQLFSSSGSSGGGVPTIALDQDSYNPKYKILRFPDGRRRAFEEQGERESDTVGGLTVVGDFIGNGQYIPLGDGEFTSLETLDTGELLYSNTRSGEKLYFNAKGQILRRVNRSGFEQTFLRQPTVTGTLVVVTDNLANQMTLTLRTDGQMAQAEVNGLTFTYSYTNGKLTEATFPDNRSRVYHYENAKFPGYLTGITDENGVRYATWQYDRYGRGILSEYAGGVGRVQLRYNELEKPTAEETSRFLISDSGGGGASGKAFIREVDKAPEVGSVTMTNELGRISTYHFEKVGGRRRITSIQSDPTPSVAATSRTRTYYGNGLLETETDERGNVTRFYYDGLGRLTQKIEAQGSAVARQITTTWHETFNQVSATSEPGRAVTLTYNADGLVATRTVGTRTWTYTYHPGGLLKAIDGPRTDVADITTLSYDGSGHLITVTNALGHKVNLSDYNSWNLPGRMVDANGVATELGYDARGRLISRTVKSLDGDATTTFTFDPLGQITAITPPNGATLHYEYDAAHRLVAMANNRGERVEYSLDPMGNRTKEVIKSGTGAIVYSHQSLFDELGRMIDDIGAAGQTSRYQYDVGGNNTGITDARGNASQQAFDALDRLNTLTDPYNNLVQFAYDGRDNPTSVTDQRGLTTTYTYNEHNELTSLISPDTGTTQFTYDAAGNIATATDARNIVTQYQYDALGRAISQHYPSDPSRDIAYDYDQSNTGASATAATYSAGVGRLSTVVDHSGSTALRYDDRGNLIEDRRTIDNLSGLSQTFSTGYQYDLANNLTGITYPDGTQVAYTRNTLGEITGISATLPGQPPQTIADNISYQPFGGIKTLTWGNGLTLNRSFDQDYRITAQTISGTQTIQGLNYQYDPVSNIIALADSVDASNTGRYEYDLIDRLIGEEKTAYRQLFSYDGVGNRTEHTSINVTTSSTATQSHTYGETSNRLTAKNGLVQSYDAVGNILNNGTTTFTYDVNNRMASASQGTGTVAGYSYNAFGQRAAKTRPDSTNQHSTAYVYNPAGQLISETTYNNAGAEQQTQHYIWLGTVPVAMLQPAANDPDPKVIYLHTDHLDTPRKATDQNQAVVWRWHSDAFGTTAANDDPDNDGIATTINLRFAGQYYDAETQLHYNYFRDYDPATGRYVQSDPIGLAGGLNTYAYVGGGPLSYVDPFGLWVPPSAAPWLVDGAAGIGDGISGGITAWVRDQAGIDGGVNKCSSVYSGSRTTGNVYSITLGVGRLVYAGVAKVYSVTASSGTAASAGRSALRRLLGGGRSLRPPDLSRYPTDAALRAAAGRTNPAANVAGAAAAGIGANDLANGDDCECRQ